MGAGACASSRTLSSVRVGTAMVKDVCEPGAIRSRLSPERAPSTCSDIICPALSGEVQATDLRITPETLRLQAQIAEKDGRKQLGANLRRAAEMTAISDERVLQIYNALRPNASTKAELDAIAEELESQYSATLLAELVREAADVYERRDILATSE